MTSAPRRSGPSSFAALGSGSFRSFTLAGMLWMMADNIEHVISYWVLHEKFASPMLGGFAVISHWAPFLFGGMFMGALADRYDCRKLFLVSMAMFMAAALGWAYFFWTDTIQVWHSVILLTLHGLAGVIFSPASQLILHDLVNDAHVPSAVRLTATSRQVGLLLGPAVGGFLLLALGPALGMVANAVIYLPMVWWSLTEPYTGHGPTGTPRTLRPMTWGMTDMVDTLRETVANRTIFGMIILVGLTSVLVGNAYQAQMPEFAHGFLGEDEGVVYTALLLASAIGAIAGGLLQEAIPSLSPSPLKATMMSALWSATILVFAYTESYLVALVAQFLAGMLMLSFISMAQSLVQIEAPTESRGRIIGVYNVALNGLKIGSGFTVGFLGAVIGVHWSLGLSAGLLLLCLAPLAYYLRGAPRALRAGSH